jgi:dephospho-CoA kinase
MKLLGLTGGIGMGKSVCAGLLRRRGIPIIDTDDLAREVVQPGQPALAEISREFGPHLIGPDGNLRRDEMARIVFTDPSARQRLEAILHPKIRAIWKERSQSWAAAGQPLGVVVIPLLYETGAEKEFNGILCVACSASTQRERLAARGWSAEQIENRIRAQIPAEKKMALANYVIWTEGGLDVHSEQLDRILPRILA